jgi:peptidoglycan/LPS O-acetylase OafA/YrhL
MPAVSRPARHAAVDRSGTRTDIQALRALAVSLVLLYHLWPHQLGGGFVGVDVFFVISGFLITAHLLAHPPTGMSDLLAFWSRRIRRLLPAALLVLVVTLGATRIFAPETIWGGTASQARSAALYVVNWRLASDSVDYLASTDTPTPVQHFWSLSVEEQFYLVWPVLILLAVAAARLTGRRPQHFVVAAIGGVVLVSFAYSIYLTGTEPARAYFVTPTRMWELGVGGALAAALSRRAFGRTRATENVALPPAGRLALAVAGLAAITWTAFGYDGATPFPGYQAALPVLGTAAVIAAKCALPWRPAQWLGDVSYSVYLWHWPLIALIPLATKHPMSVPVKLLVIAASLGLAALTKRFVEDRFRTPSWGRPLVKPYLLAAAAMSIVVVGAAAQTAEVHHLETEAAAVTQQALAHPGACFGAATLASHGRCPATNRGRLFPDPIQASHDQSDAYGSVSGRKDCWSGHPSFRIVTCVRGDSSGPVKVALVGNSHAGEWLPALERTAASRHWRITTYLASQCAFSDIAQQFETAAVDAACKRWVEGVTAALVRGGYDLVVMVNRISVPAAGHSLDESLPIYTTGYARVLRTLHRSHRRVFVIRDTPAPGQILIPQCLAEHPDHYAACDGSRADWLPPDPTGAAVRRMHDRNISFHDLTGYICAAAVCPAAIGHVVVYFDGSHLTATYARTIAPYLAPQLGHALATPG